MSAVNNSSSYPLLSENCALYSFSISSVLLGVLCVFGLFGNVTAFVVFCKDKLKTSTTFLFQSLCVIDTVLLVTAFPVYGILPFVAYTGIFPEYQRYHAIVLVYVYPIALLAQTATIWVTVLVGFNRYIAVCKPYQVARFCTVKQAMIQLVVILICALLYNLPVMADIKLEVIVLDNETIFEPKWRRLGNETLFNIIYNNILYLIFLLSLPLLILTVMNVRLIAALKALQRKRAEMQSIRQQQDNNVTLVLIIVVLVFSVCQVPALVNQILWNFLGNEARACGGFQYYFSPISNLLVIVNSAVNFLIYFLFNKRFRVLLLVLLRCRKAESCEYTTIRSQATVATNLKTQKSKSLINS